MPERSVHDNHLFGIEFDEDQHRVVLRTRFEYRQPFERTDVVFEGVIAYSFSGGAFTILFDVEEVALADFLLNHKEQLSYGEKYGQWSIDASVKVGGCSAKAFEISSSIGMGGWVIAASCRRVPAS